MSPWRKALVGAVTIRRLWWRSDPRVFVPGLSPFDLDTYLGEEFARTNSERLPNLQYHGKAGRVDTSLQSREIAPVAATKLRELLLRKPTFQPPTPKQSSECSLGEVLSFRWSPCHPLASESGGRTSRGLWIIVLSPGVGIVGSTGGQRYLWLDTDFLQTRRFVAFGAWRHPRSDEACHSTGRSVTGPPGSSAAL